MGRQDQKSLEPKPLTYDRYQATIRNILVGNIHHPFRMRVAEIAVMRRPEVDLVLVQRVLDFIREDTRRETRDQFDDLGLVRCLQDIIVDERVLAQERQFVFHVLE